MQVRNDVTKFKGNPVHLMGPQLEVGQKAPNFSVVDVDLKTVHLADFKGKNKIVCTVPSLDTPVCDAEIRRFNQEATQLDDNTVILTISMDLPFALRRWCAGARIDRVTVLSDYQNIDFAFNYGVLIKELKLLSRAIFIIGADDTIRYIQHVAELSNEPDYVAVLAAAKSEIATSQLHGDGICGGY